MRSGANRKKSKRPQMWGILILYGMGGIAISTYLKSEAVLKSYLLLLAFMAFLLFLMYMIPYIQKRIRRAKYLKSGIHQVDIMTGEEFEEFLQAHYEKLGYTVDTTPSSADYGVDLVCVKKSQGKKDEFVVQAKRSKNKIGIRAIQEIVGGMQFYGCTKGFVVTNSYFTPNARELADRCNVTLYDREYIKKELIR